MKALLFINGVPPKKLPDLESYDLIGCTDGAFHYLLKMNFPIEKLDFVSGDFDSLPKEMINEQAKTSHFEVIFTPNQEKTDFEKALEIIAKKNTKKVEIYGASGREMDHFLGNLTTAFHFRKTMELTFYDEFSTYFFAPKNLHLSFVKGKTISLFPFPKAKHITTKGLNWPLNHETLKQTKRIGTRNFATEDEVFISYKKGNLLVFLSNP